MIEGASVNHTWDGAFPKVETFTKVERESSLLTTYWSGSTDIFG